MNGGKRRQILSYIPGYTNNKLLQLIFFSALCYIMLALSWSVLMLVYNSAANYDGYFLPSIAIPALHDAAPQACILVLTVSEDEADLARALRNGAAGYLLKTTEGEDLIQAILKAHAGDNVIAPEMTNKLVAAYRGASHESGAKDASVQTVSNPLDTLSAREKEILRGITKGESNKEIGRNLGIAETTVKIHVQHILRKLGVSSRVHAAVMASENLLI